MTFYLLVPLTAAIVSAALATAIFVRDPKQRANRLATRLVGGGDILGAVRGVVEPPD